MDDYIVPVVASVFVLMFLMIIVWFIVLGNFFKFLKMNHADIYHELGEPVLFGEEAYFDTGLFLRYVFGKRYLHSSDQQLIRKSVRIKRMIVSYGVVFASVIAIMLGFGLSQ